MILKMDIQTNVGFPQEKKGKLEICDIKKDCIICFQNKQFLLLHR